MSRPTADSTEYGYLQKILLASLRALEESDRADDEKAHGLSTIELASIVFETYKITPAKRIAASRALHLLKACKLVEKHQARVGLKGHETRWRLSAKMRDAMAIKIDIPDTMGWRAEASR